jgi:ACS family glucarate transporter-like MFS transporter
MLPFIGMTLCCLAGGVINDRVAKAHGLFWGRCGIAILAFLLTGTFLLIGSQVSDTLPAVLVLAGGAGAIYLGQSSFWSVTADIAGPHTGVVSGFMNMGCQIGGAITASLTPWIAANFGWTAAFGAAAALAGVGAVAWAFVDPTRPILRAPQQTPRTLRAVA